ncbi:MAG: RNA pseudouridine synthase [Lachnospiraceae bacterium]|nr:RNA pseudouridine synthase [Lachnospiraceae bacterium]
MNKLKILLEDNDILAVFKPAGIASESARIGSMDMVSHVKNYLAEKGSGEPYAALIHRLDQPVEGILLFAKNKGSAAKLSKALQEGKFEKEYIAVVDAEEALSDEENPLVDWLIKDSKSNTSKVTQANVKGAKKAELSYRKTGETPDGAAVLRVKLMTGRHHQIRVQLSHAGMPIRGDRKYGGRSAGQLMLSAAVLRFPHPGTGKMLNMEQSPSFLDKDWQ